MVQVSEQWRSFEEVISTQGVSPQDAVLYSSFETLYQVHPGWPISRAKFRSVPAAGSQAIESTNFHDIEVVLWDN